MMNHSYQHNKKASDNTNDLPYLREYKDSQTLKKTNTIKQLYNQIPILAESMSMFTSNEVLLKSTALDDTIKIPPFHERVTPGVERATDSNTCWFSTTLRIRMQWNC